MGRQSTDKTGVYSRELADGTTVYDCVWDAGPDPKTGKRRQRQKRGFKKKAEAVRYRRDQLHDIDHGNYVDNSKLTVGDWLDTWLSSRKPRSDGGGRGHRGKVGIGTWDTYGNYIEAYIKPQIGGIRLQDLTPADVDRLYDHLEENGGRSGDGLSAKTISNVHGIVHKALDDAVKRGRVVRNVSDAVEPPKAGKPQTDDAWDVDQLRHFLTHVSEDRLYAAWLLFATTGMRRGEVAGLAWEDIDLDTGTVRIRWTLGMVDNKATWQHRAKSEAGERTMSLDPATVAALRSWKAQQAEERLAFGEGYETELEDWRGNSRTGVVFTWPDGSMIIPERWTDWFRRHCEESGLRRIRLHDVRHSYATAGLANASGWHEIKVISERLGHATVGITLDTYADALPAMDEQVADTLARIILGTESA